MGKTFVEKILAKRAGKPAVVPGEIVVVKPDFVMSHDNSAAIYGKFKQIGSGRVFDREQVLIILDHCVPAASEKYAKNHQEVRSFVEKFNIPNFFDINTGVCHQVVIEKGFARPGRLIVGSDSHTVSYGAVGAFSAGIGRSEAAAIWATGEIWLKVPSTLKVVLNGTPKPGVTAKDLMLYLIGKIGADGALYKAVEFTGEAVSRMTVADRIVFANMTVEMGGKNGYFAPDKTTFDYLKARGIDQSGYEVILPDSDADYEQVLDIDAASISPQVAKPHTVDNVSPVAEVAGTKIHQALIGTCTNGRIEDLRAAAAVLKGRKVAKSVRLLVFPASMEIYMQAMKEGLFETIIEAGGIVMNPGCGPCLGAHEGILAPGEVCISTANRNFKGRMGCKTASVYLASPETVAASAIAGEICAAEALK
ncbi:MAG: 3-isopropylmalate dehydratase large subunit [Acidobacteria bacterium]|nr:3-isopropylmalate dehydratase large subunit [Acidobacteriota bacterium]